MKEDKDNQLVIIRKYEGFLKYMDNILQEIPSARRNIKDDTERLFLRQVEYLYLAVMSNTPSRINQADTGLAEIRFRLRYLSSVKYNRTKIITLKGGEQRKKRYSTWLISRGAATTAEKILSETGRILGDMKKKAR